VFDGTLVKLIKFPAEHLTIFHGTLVENHWSKQPYLVFSFEGLNIRILLRKPHPVLCQI